MNAGDRANAEARERTLPAHGGDLTAVGAAFGIAPEHLLDFSANLNPLGPPQSLLDELRRAASDVAALRLYPEPSEANLRAIVGRRHGIDPDAIVVANGAAALIAASVAALGISRCLVPIPAFSEDAHALRAIGVEMLPVALRACDDFALDGSALIEAQQDGAADGCLITNPHNPSGALARTDLLNALVDELHARKTALVLDEAFIDYAPTETLAHAAASRDRLVVIRSLTKFYAVPALRVGYAVATPELARTMRARLPSWPVTTLASRALGAALDDPHDVAFAAHSLAQNARERTRVCAELVDLGCSPIPSSANFILVRLPTSGPTATELTRELIARDRIVVRDCSSYDGLERGRYIRIAVRSADENAALLAALARTYRNAARVRR